MTASLFSRTRWSACVKACSADGDRRVRIFQRSTVDAAPENVERSKVRSGGGSRDALIFALLVIAFVAWIWLLVWAF